MELGSKIAEYLRQSADTLTNLPIEAQRFLTNPQAFTQLVTGKNPLPKETGFVAGATGLPTKNPAQGGVLNPASAPYQEGYEQGEPVAIASMALPAYGMTLKAGAPKIYNALEDYMTKTGGMHWAYLPSTPLKPNPEVGKRFEREFLGGLAEKIPQKIENLKGSSVMVMPWDASSRNYAVKSISGEALPKDVITHGGHDYARDLKHIEEGVAGASNLGIAKRIQSRDAQARAENLAAGGTGDIVHLPITMGAGDMNFSVMPTEAMLGIIDARQPSKKFIKELDESIRSYKDPKKGTQPFNKFAGINTEEGRMQLYTGEGVKGTAGDLRKVFIDRTAGLKNRQEYLGFNAEDLAAALRDPALEGVQKGWVGNTLIKVGPEGMHLSPSKNPTYSTNFSGEYMGTLGNNVPIETLFPKLYSQFEQAYAHKKGDLRNMAIGGLEKKSAGVSELVDQEVIDNYYKYLEQMKKSGQ